MASRRGDDPGDGQQARQAKQPKLNRRRLVKTAAAAATAVAAASGYVQPSVRPLQVPVAHAFSF